MKPINNIEVCCRLYTFPNDETQYLGFEILVDGQPLTDFTDYALNLEAFLESITQDGQFYLITCWCGIPECAGITQGINVLHDQGLIHWIMTQPSPAQTLLFEPEMYARTVDAAIKQGKKLIAQAKDNNHQTVEIIPIQNEKLVALK